MMNPIEKPPFIKQRLAVTLRVVTVYLLEVQLHKVTRQYTSLGIHAMYTICGW